MVFENRVLRRIFGPKREGWRVGGAGVWRTMNNVELHNLYPSSNIIRMIKSRRIRWTGHIARMEQTRMHTLVLLENLMGKTDWKT
jgi:hypothetical protein